jgi:hypothetical protein
MDAVVNAEPGIIFGLENRTTLAEVLEELSMDPEEQLFQELGVEPRDLSSYLAGEMPGAFSLHLFGLGMWPTPEEVPGFIFPDSSYWLGLIKEGFERYLELAMLGFELKDGLFTVEQLQAKKQRYHAHSDFRELPFSIRDELPKNWPGVLLRAGKRFALDVGCGMVRVMPAERHPNYLHPCYVPAEEIPSLRARMKIRYNGTAKKNGFKKERTWYVCRL